MYHMVLVLRVLTQIWNILYGRCIKYWCYKLPCVRSYVHVSSAWNHALFSEVEPSTRIYALSIYNQVYPGCSREIIRMQSIQKRAMKQAVKVSHHTIQKIYVNKVEMSKAPKSIINKKIFLLRSLSDKACWSCIKK